jgi:hypothetical protein
MWGRLVVVVVIAFAATVAHADVDWARGLVTADGIGVANRAAPTPASARGPARRLAEEAARKRLAAQLDALPLAGGGTLEKRTKGDVKVAVDRAIAHAIVIAADPETDGSWKITMAVPIEALRLAIAGGPRAAAADDAAPAVVVVEVDKVKPAIGYKVGALEAATVFVKDVPLWAKDAPRVKAKGVKGGVIDVELPAGATAATLFVIR